MWPPCLRWLLDFGSCIPATTQQIPIDYSDVLVLELQDWYIYESPLCREKSTDECALACQLDPNGISHGYTTSRVSCVGFYRLDQDIRWFRYSGLDSRIAPGKCMCDSNPVDVQASTLNDTNVPSIVSHPYEPFGTQLTL